MTTKEQKVGPVTLISPLRVAGWWLATDERHPGVSVVAEVHEDHESLAKAVRRAQRVDHPGRVRYLEGPGTWSPPLLVRERVGGLRLAELLEGLRDTPLDIKLAVWVAREVSRTLVEMEAQDDTRPVHGGVSADSVVLDPAGRPRLLGLPTDGGPRADIDGVGRLLGDMLTKLGPATLHGAVATVLDRCLSPPEHGGFSALSELERALDRAYFGALDADESTQGASAIAALISEHLPAFQTEEADAPPESGPVTQALAARKGTVVPSALTAEDRPTHSGELVSEPVPIPAPVVQDAGPPKSDAASTSSPPASRSSEAPAPPIAQSAPADPELVPRPSRSAWFAAGFITATLMLWAYLFVFGVSPQSIETQEIVQPTAKSRR